MNIRKLLLFIAALLLPCSRMQAQSVKQEVSRDTTLLANKDTLINIRYVETHQRDTVYGETSDYYYATNRLNNWFVGGSVGLQKYCGEEDNKHGLANLTPTVRIYAGKWLLPFLAFRVGAAIQQAKGYTSTPDVSNYICGDKDSKGFYPQKWGYYAYGGDVMLSISDAISQRPDRKSRFILFAGGQMNGSFKKCNNPEAKHSASMDCGLEYHYRFARNLDLVVGGRMDIYNKSFDDEQTSHYFEYALGLDVGITWNITPMKRSNRKQWDTSMNREVNTYTTYHNVEERHNYSHTEADKDFIHPVAVFFIINKWDVRGEYEFTLKSIADDIKRTGAKFLLYGSADKATGNDSINTFLAIHRCQSVFDKLVNDYGVNPAQLIQKPQGGVDTYRTDHLNRCVIIVQDDERSIKAIEELNNQKKF